MPPQQTNLTSETGRDAGWWSSRFLFRESVSQRCDGGVGACRGQSVAPGVFHQSDGKVEAEPCASTRSVLSLLQGYWRAFQDRRQRERLRVSLHDLSDRELMDIGLTPGDIDYIVAHRAIERLRDGTTYLWMSRGVM
jgi:uncharacterized protein YjiS (DUF1127 family)